MENQNNSGVNFRKIRSTENLVKNIFLGTCAIFIGAIAYRVGADGITAVAEDIAKGATDGIYSGIAIGGVFGGALGIIGGLEERQTNEKTTFASVALSGVRGALTGATILGIYGGVSRGLGSGAFGYTDSAIDALDDSIGA